MKLARIQQKRKDGLSAALQYGKAAEHLVCADLLLRDINAFLADAGLPYDVIVDVGGRLYRVQVKSTTKLYRRRSHGTAKHSYPVYHFGFVSTRSDVKRLAAKSDVVALVALDTRQIAYVSTADLLMPNGCYPLAVDMKSRRLDYTRKGLKGTRPANVGRFMEDFSIFPPEQL